MQRREFLRHCGIAALATAGAGLCPWLAGTASAEGTTPRVGFLSPKRSPYFTALGGGTVACGLCPRACRIEPGGRGFCRVRENRDGVLYSLAYGNPCAVQVDPIEKKPFFHMLPGTRSFSIATAGCNFSCAFCQNFEISQTRPDDTANFDLPPAEVAGQAVRAGCQSIASTYVEPSIFLEYMLDVGRQAKAKGVRNTMHSNGYVAEKPLADLCPVLDAACIDLKGMTEAYYQEVTGGRLAPVLDTLRRLNAAKVHTEIVNLIVPGKNDNPADIRALCRFVHDELGAGTPLHFTRFYPMYKLKSLPPTPVATLEAARAIAVEEGLDFAYIGNVPGHPAENTLCPSCHALLIAREGFRSRVEDLEAGHCRQCGREIPGIWS